jgi:hypothetical protein
MSGKNEGKAKRASEKLKAINWISFPTLNDALHGV